MRIADPQGEWFINSSIYSFTDPESGTTFVSGELVKATPTSWVKGQPTITKQPDPLAKPVEPTKPAAKK